MRTSDYPFDVATGDLDGDGDKDFVVTHWNPMPGGPDGGVDLSVLINNGADGCTDLFQCPTLSIADPCVTTNDVDLCFFVGSCVGLSEKTFSALPFPNADDPLKVSPRFVELVDIDGDGDLDIITTRTQNNASNPSQPNGHIAIFKNLGNLPLPGGFSLIGPAALPLNTFDPNAACFTLHNILFTWAQATNPFANYPVTYTVQISDDAGFAPANIVFELPGIVGGQVTLTGADLQAIDNMNMTTHFWRVIATNGAGNTISTNVSSFTTQNRADLSADGMVNAADLASLLAVWGMSGNCADIAPETSPGVVGDGTVDAADMAFLLGNWTPGGAGNAMAQPGSGMAFGDSTIFQDGSGTNQPSQNISAPVVPWVVAHFGFDSVTSYTSWLDVLTEQELFDHIAAVLDLIAGN